MTTTQSIFESAVTRSMESNITRQYEVITYQAVSGFFGLANLYVFVALTTYEFVLTKKRPWGKKLRVLCILTALTSVLYSIIEETIVYFSSESDAACFGIMLTRTTVQSMVFSLNYAVMWLRQYKLYSTRKFRDLGNKTITAFTWIILVLIVINPMIMFSSQINDEIYRIRNNTCMVHKTQLKYLLPFLSVVFIYGFIQVV